MRRIYSVLLLIMMLTVWQGARAKTDLQGVPPNGADVLDLSGKWRMSTVTFLNSDVTAEQFDDTSWVEVSVPDRWSNQGIKAVAGTPTVAVYRRTFPTQAEWKDQKIGLAAWLFPMHSHVFLNGTALEPEGTFPYLFADVTTLLKASGDNVVAVASQFDGIYESAFPNPPRVGVIGTWDVPETEETTVKFAVGDKTIEATAYSLAGTKPHIGILMIGTGSHGLGFTEPFIPLARELAYAGYVALPMTLPAQTPEFINPALAALRNMSAFSIDGIGVIAAVSSATNVLQKGIDRTDMQVLVTLAAGNAKVEDGLSIPTLLIASTMDPNGPASVYASKIAKKLSGSSQVLILPSNQSGLALLDEHWNPIRETILQWFAEYNQKPT